MDNVINMLERVTSPKLKSAAESPKCSASLNDELTALIFLELTEATPEFMPDATDQARWIETLERHHCVDPVLIKCAIDRLREWRYMNPPTPYAFVEWYKEAARERAGLPSMAIIEGELYDLASGTLQPAQLSPGAYTVYSKLGMHKIKQCNDTVLKTLVRGAYERVTRLFDERGASALLSPQNALEAPTRYGVPDYDPSPAKTAMAIARRARPEYDSVKNRIDELRGALRG